MFTLDIGKVLCKKTVNFPPHVDKLRKSPVEVCRSCTMNQAITTVNTTYHGKCELALPHIHANTNPAAGDKTRGITN